MRPTLAEFFNTLEIMRTVYPFKDDETLIADMRNPISGEYDRISIVTKDITGTIVTLEREIERDNRKPEQNRGC